MTGSNSSSRTPSGSHTRSKSPGCCLLVTKLPSSQIRSHPALANSSNTRRRPFNRCRRRSFHPKRFSTSSQVPIWIPGGKAPASNSGSITQLYCCVTPMQVRTDRGTLHASAASATSAVPSTAIGSDRYRTVQPYTCGDGDRDVSPPPSTLTDRQ